MNLSFLLFPLLALAGPPGPTVPACDLPAIKRTLTRPITIAVGKLSDVDPKTLQVFADEPKFDGTKSIPPDLDITLAFHEEGDPRTFMTQFQTASIAAQTKQLRELFKDLKRRSRKRGYVEFAAIVFEYEDGTVRVLKHSSNDKNFVFVRDLNKALDGADSTLPREHVRRLLYVHTHPPNERGVDFMRTPSRDDYLSLRNIQNVVMSWSADGPSVEGVALPTDSKLDDILFLFRANGLK